MTRPLDAAPRALLLTEASRRQLEAELQDLCAARDGDQDAGGLRTAPQDPAMTVQGRIQQLEDALQEAVVLHTGPDGPEVVAVGTTVEVLEDDVPRRYRVVFTCPRAASGGPVEIRTSSPLGAALLWRHAGAEADVRRPDGALSRVRVLRVSEPVMEPAAVVAPSLNLVRTLVGRLRG